MKNMLGNALVMMALTASCGVSAQNNVLTQEERAEGWELLFDGHDLSKWRNFKKDGLSEKWQAINGEMVLTGADGGDILTKKKYADFDLKLEWKISQAGNSGIFVLADELGDKIYSNAIEVQILDNERHSDNKLASHLSGSIYDIVASPASSHKPAGEWNHVRIYLNQRHLKVWQNGEKTAEITVGSDEWNDLVSRSKFSTWEGFAKAEGGYIGLQDHGNRVAFRNIKIKEM
ncbi:DUF1080 domain-containing protein [Microbulbifer magnicolonia]|uniref:3-keto-disaccharide hydrolase n=1 Tax=Microbulbifer magnicolonia TaxID=3109744 RepID=UPI002B404301|nr:DUF1080 domain-containing protein [Microbulbifer sp. GG15]